MAWRYPVFIGQFIQHSIQRRTQNVHFPDLKGFNVNLIFTIKSFYHLKYNLKFKIYFSRCCFNEQVRISVFRFWNGIKDLIKKINLNFNLLYSENLLSLHCKRRREHQLLLHIFNTLHFILYIFKQIYTQIRLTFSKFVAILLFQNFIIILSKRKYL